MFKQEDIQKIRNILAALKRAKFDNFTGAEAIALVQIFNWLESVIADSENSDRNEK